MQYLDDDIVDLRRDDGEREQFYWGDRCQVIGEEHGAMRVVIHGARGPVANGLIDRRTGLRDTPLLRLSMVDVQQGDGLILETPGGKVVFIDGGDNQLFARHANARFPGTSDADPLVVDLMLVTHGDADHFAGLSRLRESETDTRPGKRIFVAPRRVYHNGIVKRPSKRDGRELRDVEMLGPTIDVDGEPYLTGLVDDPAAVPAADRNEPFTDWVETLEVWDERTLRVTGSPIERRRIDQGAQRAFDFLAEEGLSVQLLGPIAMEVDGGLALPFLRDPPDDAKLMLGTVEPARRGSPSASHTINGHSINFRLTHGNVRMLFTGDLNQEAGRRMREALPAASLQAEILKAPHHGSADFDMALLEAVSPVVSLISSGDERTAKEYIHPRATLVAALGKASRTTPGVIFCTELAAFFSVVGYVDDPRPKRHGRVFAFERTNFGIAHVRTDGERVLAFTHSGRAFMNEAYRFTVSPSGEVEFASKVVKRSAPPGGGHR
ncbi:MAG TPA: MBL fold metallo-hydrolase [Sphingomonas sp.]|jgi:hypothetical protein